MLLRNGVVPPSYHRQTSVFLSSPAPLSLLRMPPHHCLDGTETQTSCQVPHEWPWCARGNETRLMSDCLVPGESFALQNVFAFSKHKY